MSNTGFYICTECFWSGKESDLHTKFSSRHSDEEVCPNCGAFEQCVPQSEAVILTDGQFNFPFVNTSVPNMLGMGWRETEITVQDFINSLKIK